MILFLSSMDAAPTERYALSLHDALPIWMARSTRGPRRARGNGVRSGGGGAQLDLARLDPPRNPQPAGTAGAPVQNGRSADRKSTRLNSSHPSISYAVFCLKKKNKTHPRM